MSNVAHRRGSSKIPEALRLHDPLHVACWLEDLTNQFHDLLSASRDATSRKRDRVLSRASARTKIEEAADAIEQLLFGLRRGLIESGPGNTGAPPNPSSPAAPPDPGSPAVPN